MLVVGEMPTVAIVSSDSQDELVHYLVDQGFEASQVQGLARCERTLIWLVDPAADDRSVADDLGDWLRGSGARRAVIVSDRPTRLRHLLARVIDRVGLLPAPAFGWQLVDAIRELLHVEI